MKKGFYFAIYFISLAVIIYSIYFIHSILSLPIESKSLQVVYIVGPITGFDVNQSALTFGEIMHGSSSARTITLRNDHDFPINVLFVSSSNLDRFINYNRTMQRMEVNETKSFSILLTVPEDEPFGNYSGNFSALIYKAQN